MSSARWLLSIFWIAQALAWIWTCRTLIRHGRDRAWTAFLAPAAIAALGITIAAVLEAPYSPWDVVRLAPTAAIARGFPLYSGRSTGAILSTMYTPFSSLAYLPAILFREPAREAMAGRFISCALVFGPIWLFCLAPLKNHLKRLMIFVPALLACSFSPALWYSGTRIHADAPAIAMLALACWFETGKRSTATGLLAGLCAWLAVWAKQTMIALPIGLMLWSFATLDSRAALWRERSPSPSFSSHRSSPGRPRHSTTR